MLATLTPDTGAKVGGSNPPPATNRFNNLGHPPEGALSNCPCFVRVLKLCGALTHESMSVKAASNI